MSFDFNLMDDLFDKKGDCGEPDCQQEKPCLPAPPKEDCGCVKGCPCQETKEFCCKECLKEPCVYTRYECKYVCRRKVFEPPMKRTCCSPFCKAESCCKCCKCCCDCCCK